MGKTRLGRQEFLAGKMTVSGAVTAGGALTGASLSLTTTPLPHAQLDHMIERYADVTVSTAELLALNATPKQLVAAPGAAYALILTGALLYLPYATIAYNGIAAGEDLAVKYTNGSGLQVASCEATGFLDATADAFRWMHSYRAASGVSDIVAVANAALVLQMLTGEIATGNSPLKVRTFYRRVPISF